MLLGGGGEGANIKYLTMKGVGAGRILRKSQFYSHEYFSTEIETYFLSKDIYMYLQC